jgi:hypothetical protein
MGVPYRFPGIAVNTEAVLHHDASACACANCDAAVSGHFCHQCGQETVLHRPSTREFLHEFIGHYVALEGKLWQTMKLLLLKPGQLTLEYMRGRRVRYIEPLRVYLTFSLIFFALFKFMGEDHHIGGVKVAGTPFVQTDPEDARHKPQAKPAPASPAGDRDVGNKAVGARGEENEAAGEKDDEKDGKDPISVFVDKMVDGFTADKGHAARTAFFASAPYAVFAMMPVFALFLKLLYIRSGRRYGEHLLFALHTNAFAFLMLSLLIVAGNVPYAGKLLFLWLAFYLPIAMRRVYGGGRFLTFVRWCVLMFVHVTSMSVAISIVLYRALS